MALLSSSSCQTVNPSESSLNLCTNGPVQEVLKCFFCEKYLSVAPIYNHEFESICGRCKFVNKAEDCKWTRQLLYESVAQYMIFPCSNAPYGCKAQLKWGEVEEHESTCLHKKLNCPFINDDVFETDKCKWSGSGPGLNEHLESHHADHIKKLPEINFTDTKKNCIFLTRILKQLMIVTITYEPPEKLSCLAMVNGTSTDCEAYRYQLELYDENRKNSVILRRNRLEDAVGFEENLVNGDKMLTVELSVIKELLKNPATVMGRFGIIKKSKREINYGDRGLNPGGEGVFDENFLRELECPVCKNYMAPPIQICSTGHSFCHRCKLQMDECPTCRHPFQDGRNYTLEKLTTCVSYPCMYREAGCSVACSGERIREHEQDCAFSGIQCFLDCATGPVVSMFRHLNEKHHDSLIVAGDVHILDVGDKEEEIFRFFAICFGNDIFRLVVWYDGDIKFSLQQFGVKTSGYAFELEIVCSTEVSEKIVLGRECRPMGKDGVWEKCVELAEDVIDRFISEDELIFFKVHLKKLP